MKRVVMGELDNIKESLQRLLRKKKAVNISDLLPENSRLANNLPSFLRINSLKVRDKGHFTTVMNAIRNLCPEAKMDEHIDNLVVLPSGSISFGQHELVKDGTIIIQDKASCFPSQILSDAWSGEGRNRCMCRTRKQNVARGSNSNNKDEKFNREMPL